MIKLESKLQESLTKNPTKYQEFPFERILNLHNKDYVPSSTLEMVDYLEGLSSKYLSF